MAQDRRAGRGPATGLSVASLLLLLVAAAEAHAGPGTLLVGYEDEVAAERIVALAEARGGAVRRCSPTARLCILDFDGAAPLDAFSGLRGVRWVERDRLLPDPGLAPTDPEDGPAGRAVPAPFDDLGGTAACGPAWELELVRADRVWPMVNGWAGPIVAVQDSGFLTSHVDLAGRVVGEHDYGDHDPVAEVHPGVAIPHHGTFIAGLIAGLPDNGQGRIGIVPWGRLLLQRIVDSAGNFWLSYAVDAMTDVSDDHPEVRVLSYSLAGPWDQALADAVTALGRADVLLVTAAANCASAPGCWDGDNDAYPLYPPCQTDEHVITVANTDRYDRLNEWSHYGRQSVDLSAPGTDLCSLEIGSDWATGVHSGTSYAAPLVAGAAALLFEAHPDLGAVEAARVLRASAAAVPGLEGVVQSGGRLDVEAAVAASVPRLAWPPNLVVDGSWTEAIGVSNVGGAGEATLLLLHGDEVEVRGGGRFGGVPFARGETLDLPDVGPFVAPSAGTLVRGRLEAHESASIPLTFRGLRPGRTDATIRLVVVSDRSTVLGSPFGQGVIDPTGQAAHPFSIEVRSVAPSGSDLPSDEPGGGAEVGPSAGCAAAPGRGPAAGGGLAALAAAALLAIRRARRS